MSQTCVAEPNTVNTILQVEINLQVVTPLFMNTLRPEERYAAPDSSALRPPGIKSMMRFWYRALAAGLTSDLGSIRRLEGQVFGAHDSEVGVGVQIIPKTTPPSSRDEEKPWVYRLPPNRDDKAGLKYLAYGRTMDGNRQLEPALKPGTPWAIKLQIRPHPKALMKMQLAVDALWVASHLGNFGGRSRRGWGKLIISGWQGVEQLALPALCWEAENPEEARKRLVKGLKAVRERLKSALGDAPAGTYPQCSRLESAGAVFMSHTDYTDWADALDEAGNCLRRYRSEKEVMCGPDWSGDAKLKGWLKDDAGASCPSTIQRLAFGLPWGYRSNAVQKHWLGGDKPPAVRARVNQLRTLKKMNEFRKLQDQLRDSENKSSVVFNASQGHGNNRQELRRASPLLLSVLPSNRGETMTVLWLWLQGEFLPNNSSISGKKRADNSWGKPQAGAAKVIREYLTHLQTQGLVGEVVS